jgi:hypothetical protein
MELRQQLIRPPARSDEPKIQFLVDIPAQNGPRKKSGADGRRLLQKETTIKP